jgi:hypothetical protein
MVLLGEDLISRVITLYSTHWCSSLSKCLPGLCQSQGSTCSNGEKKAGWWYKPIIPGLRRLREEDHKFKDSLDYIVNSRLAWNA